MRSLGNVRRRGGVLPLLGWGLLTAWGLVGLSLKRPSLLGGEALQSAMGSASSLAACLILGLLVWRCHPWELSVARGRVVIGALALTVSLGSWAGELAHGAENPAVALALQAVASFAYVGLMGLWFVAYVPRDPQVIEGQAVWSTVVCAAVVACSAILPKTLALVLWVALPLVSGAALVWVFPGVSSTPVSPKTAPATWGSLPANGSRALGSHGAAYMANITICGFALALPGALAPWTAADTQPLYMQIGNVGGLILAAGLALWYVTSAQRIDLQSLFKGLYPLAALSLFLTGVPQEHVSALGIALGAAGQWALYVSVWLYAAERCRARTAGALRRFVEARAPFDAGIVLAALGVVGLSQVLGATPVALLPYLLFGALVACVFAHALLPSMDAVGEDAIQPDAGASPPVLDDLMAARAQRFASHYALSERESQILLRILRGYSTAAIRNELVIAKGTVDTYIQRIYRKCGVHSRQELVELAEREGPQGSL